MIWTIGDSGTHDNAVAFARNERECYGLKDPQSDLPSHLPATTMKMPFRKTGGAPPLEYPQDLFSPQRKSSSGRR